MEPKRVKNLEDEEPPISFYADLVEQGVVEVEYNKEGGLMVTQGTQYDKEPEKGHWLGPIVIKLVLVLCGILTTYTAHRIAFTPIPCTCIDSEGCANPGIYLLHILRSLLGI
ncbi:hypothetical protein KR054_010452 [Drosophila jambulina]|nr:hypothetical protein KR054_010452 [Drosophila jambulina]